MLNSVHQLFKTNSVISHIENFKQYEYIALVTVTKNTEISAQYYDELVQYFSLLNCEWSLELQDFEYAISQNSYKIFEYNGLEDAIESKLVLKVFKSNRSISILNEQLFFENLNQMSLSGILQIFNSLPKPIIIKNPSTEDSFSTNLIGYNAEASPLYPNKDLSIQCLFYNFSEFRFYPENFASANEESKDQFLFLIRRLQMIFLLIFLFDISEIRNNQILLTIKGHQTFSYSLELNKITLTSFSEYLNIYTWVYSTKDKVEDKIGIARNIMGFYLKANEITLDPRVFPSILSANQLYLKKNLSKYLDSRSKVYEQVEQIGSKINTSLDSFLGNFQKSVFVFVSFYLTIFIVKIFTQPDVTSILGKESTLFAVGLLILSGTYLFFSCYVLNKDLARANDKYELVKKRFEDILNQEDISRILNADQEFINDMVFYKDRRNSYVKLWILTIGILLVALFTTSDFINFKYIYTPDNIEKKINTNNK